MRNCQQIIYIGIMIASNMLTFLIKMLVIYRKVLIFKG